MPLSQDAVVRCIYLLEVKDGSLNVSDVGGLKSMIQHCSGFPHTKLLCLQHGDFKRSTLGEREKGRRKRGRERGIGGEGRQRGGERGMDGG